MQVRLEFLQRPLEPGDVRVQPALQGPGPGQPPAVGFGPEHFDQLAAGGDELA